MRSLAELGSWVERVCRVGAFMLLAYLAYRELVPGNRSALPKATEARIADLPDLTRRDSLTHIHFALSETPNVAERAWQQSLRQLGTKITWSGNLLPIALSARPAASPAGGYLLSGFAGRGGYVKVRDEISSIDSLPTHSGFLSTPFSVTSGVVRAAAGSDAASAASRDSVVLRRVLVIGKAGWETKFVLAALEEAGWKTDAAILVAPGVSVDQGDISSIDTAHYAAVVAVDESAGSRARQVAEFARTGGGVVIGNAAAASEALAGLRVSQDARKSSQVQPADDIASRAETAFGALRISADAVPLEVRNGSVAVAAKRFGFGRVAQIAFEETWRWRMQGNARAVSDHRNWWSGLVSQVAHAPRVTIASSPDDRAPFSDLITIAGNATKAPIAAKSLADGRWRFIWILVLLGLLMLEWTSRRLRGAR